MDKAAGPIRVLHIMNVEAGNYYLNNLADFTDRSAVEYQALTFGAAGEFTKQLESRGVRTYALDCRSRSGYGQAAWQMREIIQSQKIDILHPHYFELTLLSLGLAKTMRRKLVITRHHSDSIYQIPQAFKRGGYLRLERLINAGADHLIAPSQMVRRILIEREGVCSAKVSLIPYGQTSERFDAVTTEMVEHTRQALSMAGRRALVCVSRLHPEKGHRFLFEALAEVRKKRPDVFLYLVGEGWARQTLEELARRLAIDSHVRFLGYRDDALAIMAAAELVVHSSLQEALPSAVIEALMLKKALVVTDVSGVRDLVGDDRHGRIVPPADAPALGRAILGALSDPQEALNRAELGCKFVLQNLDARRVANDYVQCYQKVMQ